MDYLICGGIWLANFFLWNVLWNVLLLLKHQRFFENSKICKQVKSLKAFFVYIHIHTKQRNGKFCVHESVCALKNQWKKKMFYSRFRSVNVGKEEKLMMKKLYSFYLAFMGKETIIFFNNMAFARLSIVCGLKNRYIIIEQVKIYNNTSSSYNKKNVAIIWQLLRNFFSISSFLHQSSVYKRYYLKIMFIFVDGFNSNRHATILFEKYVYYCLK